MPKRKVAAVRYDSQVNVRMQQQKKLWNFREDGGANAATQWYWPPAVGYLYSDCQQCTSRAKFK